MTETCPFEECYPYDTMQMHYAKEVSVGSQATFINLGIVEVLSDDALEPP